MESVNDDVRGIERAWGCFLALMLEMETTKELPIEKNNQHD